MSELQVINKKDVLVYTLGLINPQYNHALEFGVGKGDSLTIIRKRLKPTIKIFGFDSFYGLPIDWKGTSCYAGAFSTGGVVPNIRNVTFYSGWFKDTLPQYIQVADKIGFLHIDCDLYESTVEVLDALNPFIVENTIILFDEWLYWARESNQYMSDCEQKAFYEWVIKYNRKYQMINYKEVKKTDDLPIEQQIIKIIG